MATLELPYEKVYDLLHKCCTSISPDVLYLMKRAAATRCIEYPCSSKT